jgi:hypothetical protein
MKKIATVLLLCLLSFPAFSSETIPATQDESVRVLDLVVGIKQTYSKASELEAKVVELLAGDGMNPTRMVLVLGTGDPMEANRIFELSPMMYEVTRITFTDIDQIQINYTQDSFDENDNTIQVKKSMKIQVLRKADRSLTGEIKILD